MSNEPPPVPPLAANPELEHLYRVFSRLAEIGATRSPTIENLKRIVMLRIAELEASPDRKAPESA